MEDKSELPWPYSPLLFFYFTFIFLLLKGKAEICPWKCICCFNSIKEKKCKLAKGLY